jgi:mRNA-degrading endonuclease RelE of RelBE toxin-antitoxin system
MSPKRRSLMVLYFHSQFTECLKKIDQNTAKIFKNLVNLSSKTGLIFFNFFQKSGRTFQTFGKLRVETQ